MFDNTDRRHRTRVYVLRVTRLKEDNYDDHGRRKRCWFPVEEAKRLLAAYKPLHCKYVVALRATTPSVAAAAANGDEEPVAAAAAGMIPVKPLTPPALAAAVPAAIPNAHQVT